MCSWLDAMGVLVKPKTYPKHIGFQVIAPSKEDIQKDWEHANSWNSYFAHVVINQALSTQIASFDNDASRPRNPVARLHTGHWQLRETFAKFGKADVYDAFLLRHFNGKESNLLKSQLTLQRVFISVLVLNGDLYQPN